MSAAKNILYTTLAGITFFLTGVYAFISLAEFVNVGIFENTYLYPFGGEGPVPWYYESAELYARYSLVTGLISLAILIFSVWSFLKKKRVWVILAYAATVLMLALKLIFLIRRL
jgi:hypothetical protein